VNPLRVSLRKPEPKVREKEVCEEIDRLKLEWEWRPKSWGGRAFKDVAE
jgi:hypothetical protein